MTKTREYPDRPLVGAGALVTKGSKVLLVLRSFPPNEGTWSIPGGLVELGETPEDAAVREAKEETGLDVDLDGLLGVSTDVHLDGSGVPRYHFILVDYVAHAAGGRLRLNRESSDWHWFTKEEAERAKMTKVTKNAVLSYFKNRRGEHTGKARTGST